MKRKNKRRKYPKPKYQRALAKVNLTRFQKFLILLQRNLMYTRDQMNQFSTLLERIGMGSGAILSGIPLLKMVQDGQVSVRACLLIIIGAIVYLFFGILAIYLKGNTK